jgi:hypothetical protein
LRRVWLNVGGGDETAATAAAATVVEERARGCIYGNIEEWTKLGLAYLLSMSRAVVSWEFETGF